MNKRLSIAFLVVLLAGIIVAIGSRFYRREPEYQGKKLTAWLAEVENRDDWRFADQEKVRKAVKQFGTNAIPFLLETLEAEDAEVKGKVAGWLNRTFGLKINFQSPDELRDQARFGFLVLGRDAEAAIPALALALTNQNENLAFAAGECLWAIDSTNCVPALVSVLTNANRRVQDQVASVLRRMGGKATAAGPILLTRVDDENSRPRWPVMFALANIGFEPQTVVPIASRWLTDTNWSVRASAAGCLASLGPAAVSATLPLKVAAQDTNKMVRTFAARALVRVQCEMHEGGIIRGPKDERKIALAFTGHEFAEGGEIILDELLRHQAKASFFLTGNFLANPQLANVVGRIVREGHGLGPHSYQHVLYCDWTDPKKTLITHDEFWFDLVANLRLVDHSGAERTRPAYFLPPYEYYNREIADWSSDMSATLINFTPGTRANADYTGEADTNFVSSQAIFDSIVKREREDPHGLNGFILLLHLGSGPGRADKFPARFGELLDYLSGQGYQFVRVDELLEPKS